MTKAELAWVDEQIRGFETALAALVDELGEANPRLLAVTRVAYERRIERLKQERDQGQMGI